MLPQDFFAAQQAAGGTVCAVWNPIPHYNDRFGEGDGTVHGRYPLAIAASWDNGKTFSQPTAFEWDEGRGYCYCAMCFTEDALLLAYCPGRNREDRRRLNRTWIRRIEKSELTQV